MMSDQTNEATTVNPVEPSKPTLEPIEIYRRNIHTMSNRQLSAHLRRKTRQRTSMMDQTWATILSVVFDNTQSSGVGGKMAPYLR
jgi:hypothetical protein